MNIPLPPILQYTCRTIWFSNSGATLQVHQTPNLSAQSTINVPGHAGVTVFLTSLPMFRSTNNCTSIRFTPRSSSSLLLNWTLEAARNEGNPGQLFGITPTDLQLLLGTLWFPLSELLRRGFRSRKPAPYWCSTLGKCSTMSSSRLDQLIYSLLMSWMETTSLSLEQLIIRCPRMPI